MTTVIEATEAATDETALKESRQRAVERWHAALDAERDLQEVAEQIRILEGRDSTLGINELRLVRHDLPPLTPELREPYEQYRVAHDTMLEGVTAKAELVRTAPAWIDESMQPICDKLRAINQRQEKLLEKVNDLFIRPGAKRELEAAQAERLKLEQERTRLSHELEQIGQRKLEAWPTPVV